MTSENSKPKAAPAADPQAQGSARRRLLKGSFAAPAAMTLCSGSALAASSTQCLKIGNAFNATPLFTSSDTSTTTFWRVQVYDAQTDPGAQWIKGADVVALNGAGASPFLASTEYYKYKKNNANTGLGVGTKTTATSAFGSLVPSSPQQWVGVRVNSVGNIVGIQGMTSQINHATTGPMTASCWTSFKA
jgi:hypothetical protein